MRERLNTYIIRNSIRRYAGQYANAFSCLYMNNLRLYFSYDKLIAFSHNDRVYIRPNIWSRTTAKHMNFIRRQNPDYLDVSEQLFMDSIANITGSSLPHVESWTYNNMWRESMLH